MFLSCLVLLPSSVVFLLSCLGTLGGSRQCCCGWDGVPRLVRVFVCSVLSWLWLSCSFFAHVIADIFGSVLWFHPWTAVLEANGVL